MASNEEDLKRFEQVFRTMKSYRDESIDAEDLTAFFKGIKHERTPEQIKKYAEFLDKFTEGKWYIKDMRRFASTQHDPNQILQFEYQYGIGTLRVHDTVGKDVLNEQFVKEADTNKDGKG